jgi:hypothetical protein
MSDSLPPSGRDLPRTNPTGVSEALAQVRVYSDDAALLRVWNRLETRRHRSPVLAPTMRVALSAALVAAGVFLGVFYERARVEEERAISAVASEVLSPPEAPAGLVNDGSRTRAVPSDKAAEAERKTRARRRVQRLSTPVRPATEPSAEVAPAGVVPAAPNLVVPQAKAEWVLLVERGEYAAAYQRLEESGGFDAVLTDGSSEELMTLVEVARFVGQQGRAIEALRAVTERHRDDQNAPIAAMILGNLLNKSGDTVGAAEAYALNRRLSPGGDFAEDALVGEFDMALLAGDVARVERLRAKYAAEFPEGRHLESINAEARRLSERSRVATPSVDAAPDDSEETSEDVALHDAESEDDESAPEPHEAPSD